MMESKSDRFIDRVLITMAIFDALFVVVMIAIFIAFQAVPDTLILAVFGATFGECGCCSYVWKKKVVKDVGKSENNLDISSSADDVSG